MTHAGWMLRLQFLLLCQFLAPILAHASPTAGHGLGDEDCSNATTTIGHRTGNGYAFAESCQAELRRWSQASSSYGREHGYRSTSYFTSEMTVATVIPGSTKITSLITLCDGYPRVVGQVSFASAKTSSFETSWTNTNPTFVFASYPTPAPCSINPQDCKLLYNSWTSHYHNMTKGPGFDGLLDPPCTTEMSSQTFTTDSKGNVCDNCLVLGSKIRLLYWPIVTKIGSGNLCNKTAETISATPTGDGLNIFVTSGVTITSPSVAVSIGGLSRVDKCGTTVANTIIPVLPEDVSSVNGARAFFSHLPFNFADLNYRCMSDPDVIYITTSDRTDCYQEVPASAYFWGYANAAGANLFTANPFANSTIWPSYQPQVLPPNTLTEAIRSLWGPNCYIHPDGVWDPPIALGHEKSIPLPNAQPGAPTEYATPTSNPAMPALPTYAHASATPPDGTSPAADPSKQPASPSTRISGDGPVHAVHTSILTLPAKNGVGTVTAIYGADGTTLFAAGSTLQLNAVRTRSAVLHASHDPEESSPVHRQLMTINGAEYMVKRMSSEGLDFIGQSTTIRVHIGDARSTRSAGTLALATEASSVGPNGQTTGTQDSGVRESVSTSTSGASTALMTSIHLSLLAIIAVVFV